MLKTKQASANIDHINAQNFNVIKFGFIERTQTYGASHLNIS